MQTQNNGGDVLARGGIRAQFGPAKVSQEKWDEAFADFDPQKFLRTGEPAAEQTDSRD